MISIKTSTRINSALTLCVLLLQFSVEARIDDTTADNLSIVALSDGVVYGIGTKDRGTIFEMDEGIVPRVSQVTEDNCVVIKIGGKDVLISSPSKEYVDGDGIYSKYFFYVGIGKFTSSQLISPHTVRKFRELSAREIEQVETAKLELRQIIEREKFEKRRMASIRKAHAEIYELTDDDKVINSAFEKVQNVFDEAYRKSRSEKDAVAFSNKVAARIISCIKADIAERQKRKEAEFKEWERTHPEEYAEMLRQEELERQRRAKVKLDAEIADTNKRLGELKSVIEKFRNSAELGDCPRTIRDILRFSRKYLEKNDAWGNGFIYELLDSGYILLSIGPDKKRGTVDDIIIKGDAILAENTKLGKELAKIRSDLVAASTELRNYRGKFIPSICGYNFGSVRPHDVFENTTIVTLKRPFRKCRQTVLTYSGVSDQMLVSICLVAGFDCSTEGTFASVDECKKIVQLLERKYKINFVKSGHGDVFIGMFSGNGMEIEVRNDALLQSGEQALTVSFSDTHLLAGIDKLQKLMTELEEKEIEFNQLRQIKKEKVAIPQSQIDDDGADVLSDEVFTNSVDVTTGGVINSLSAGFSVSVEIERIRRFREEMESLRMQRQKVKEDKTVGRSGIIEAKREGRVISTTDGTQCKRSR